MTTLSLSACLNNPSAETLTALNRAMCEATGWRMVAKNSSNPPPASFRLCPSCGYYGSWHSGFEGMPGCKSECEMGWLSAYDQWTLDGESCPPQPRYLGAPESLWLLHEAEKTLTAEQCSAYCDLLSGNEPTDHGCEADEWWFHASDVHRVIAYLQVVRQDIFTE